MTAWTDLFGETKTKNPKEPQSLGQSLWGIEQANYGIPKHVEKALLTKRSLILWGCMFLMAFAVAPGLFPQVRDFILFAEIGMKEEAIRIIAFFIGSFGLTWLADRSWFRAKSED